MVSEPSEDAAVHAEPQPFMHLSVPNAALYRSLLRTFARAKERFIVHLRPEDVAADLRIDADDQLAQALEQLVAWGNLRADVDTSRVTTVEDFHRKRSLYQLTAAGQAAEQAITFYEEAIGRRGQLQSVALADIADMLRSLKVLAAEEDPDPAKVHLQLLSVADRFSSLADNAQAFMSALRRAIDFSDGNIDGFLAYKERLIDYINRFITDLANSGAQIAVLLHELEEAGHERLLLLAARREAADAVPEGADAAPSSQPSMRACLAGVISTMVRRRSAGSADRVTKPARPRSARMLLTVGRVRSSRAARAPTVSGPPRSCSRAATCRGPSGAGMSGAAWSWERRMPLATRGTGRRLGWSSGSGISGARSPCAAGSIRSTAMARSGPTGRSPASWSCRRRR